MTESYLESPYDGRGFYWDGRLIRGTRTKVPMGECLMEGEPHLFADTPEEAQTVVDHEFRRSQRELIAGWEARHLDSLSTPMLIKAREASKDVWVIYHMPNPVTARRRSWIRLAVVSGLTRDWAGQTLANERKGAVYAVLVTEEGGIAGDVNKIEYRPALHHGPDREITPWRAPQRNSRA